MSDPEGLTPCRGLTHERCASQYRCQPFSIAGFARARFLPLGPVAEGAAGALPVADRVPPHDALFRAARPAGWRPARRSGARGRQDAAAAGAAQPARRGPPEHRQGAGLPGDGAAGVRRAGAGGGVAPAGARLAPAAGSGQQVRTHLPVRPVRVWAAVPRQHDGQPDPHHPPLCGARAAGALSAGAAGGGHGGPAAGRHVHDRAVRRLRRGRHRDAGRPPVRAIGIGRSLAALRRQVVLLQRRCRPGAGAGAPRRCTRKRTGGYCRPRPVPDAAHAPLGRAQPLSHRAPQGQARHACHAVRRDRSGGSGGVARRRPGPRLQADGRDGEPVAPVERDPLSRNDAARGARSLDGGAGPPRLRPAPDRAAAGAATADQDDPADGGSAQRRALHRRLPRPRRRRRSGGAHSAPHPDTAHQAARLPRGAQSGGRRHGDARRQRLHRGVDRAEAAARDAPGLDLGRHEQHHRPRRGAGGGEGGRAPRPGAAAEDDGRGRIRWRGGAVDGTPRCRSGAA